MDWSDVTLDELLTALKEVDWASPPRPLTEFIDFSKFTPPKNQSKWMGRLKCNLYFYRTNYFMVVIFVLGLGFVRNPLALVAVGLAALSTACLNDSFAVSFSERITRIVRRVSPPLAAKLRPSTGSGPRGRPTKGTVHILGRDQRLVILLLASVSAVLLYLTSALKTVAGALALGLTLSLLHATFRTPNLKARLNSYREEFRAVWRGFSDA
eukprot:TRINITY_DN18792_c0_g1_i1.p1 TRINITY_DN18792_c0_g1~~TRINITY_DN18792_c0_g1_i1.p1  ORF type:complete len:211 (+),score=29.22 TRINITY_DN18792_c0_g1_i1:246-878(+)